MKSSLFSRVSIKKSNTLTSYSIQNMLIVPLLPSNPGGIPSQVIHEWEKKQKKQKLTINESILTTTELAWELPNPPENRVSRKMTSSCFLSKGVPMVWINSLAWISWPSEKKGGRNRMLRDRIFIYFFKLLSLSDVAFCSPQCVNVNSHYITAWITTVAAPMMLHIGQTRKKKEIHYERELNKICCHHKKNKNAQPQKKFPYFTNKHVWLAQKKPSCLASL